MPTYILGPNTGDDYAATTRFGSIRSGVSNLDNFDHVSIDHDYTLGYAGAAGFLGKFDLTVLPAGFVVTAAKIQLYGYGDSGYSPYFQGSWDHSARGFRLLQSWKAAQDKGADEYPVGWINRWIGDWGGTTHPWDEPGARGLTDRGGSAAFSWVMVGLEDTLEEITVPAAEINYLIENPSENFGWVFEVVDTVEPDDGNSTFVKYWAEEGTDGFRPRLVVTGAVGSSGVDDAMDFDGAVGLGAGLALDELILVNDTVAMDGAIGFGADFALDELILINDALAMDGAVGMSAAFSAMVDDALIMTGALGLSASFTLDEFILVNDALVMDGGLGFSASFTLSSVTSVNDSLPLSGAFGISARLEPADTVPAQFNLGGPVLGADLATVYNAAEFTITGTTDGVDLIVTPTNGLVSINNAAYTAATTTAQNGDSVRFRITSSALYTTQIIGTLAINGISDTFAVTTEAAPLFPRGPWDPFDTRLIEARLRDVQFNFESVLGAADYAAVKDLASFRANTVYVVLASEQNAANSSPQGRNKTAATVTIGVISVARSYRDVSGAAASREVSGSVGRARSALIGWAPEGCTPCIWQQGDVLDYDRSNILFIDIYTTTHILGSTQ